jgi:hypothetical protein
MIVSQVFLPFFWKSNRNNGNLSKIFETAAKSYNKLLLGLLTPLKTLNIGNLEYVTFDDF